MIAKGNPVGGVAGTDLGDLSVSVLRFSGVGLQGWTLG